MPIFHSFAKINLSLAVIGRRSDGFHELVTTFQTVDLSDRLSIEVSRQPGVRLTLSGADLPVDESNLAVRAANAFLTDWGAADDGVEIDLEKRIPAGGGLGGGSSNAATVLMALAQLSSRTPDRGWLETAARRLGADVPFFLVGGTARGRGRGDEIEPLGDAPAPSGELWIAVPPWGLSTAEVFGAFGAAPPVAAGRPASASPAGGAEFGNWIGENDLEAIAFALRPELGALYTALVRSGARRVRMSGSGSTLYALYDEVGAGERAAASIPPDTVWRRVETLGRAAWRSASGFESERRGV